MKMDGLIAYYGNINPFTLNDDEWSSIYNSIRWIIDQKNSKEK